MEPKSAPWHISFTRRYEMHEKELAKLLDKYILTQGFPERIDEENRDYVKK